MDILLPAIFIKVFNYQQELFVSHDGVVSLYFRKSY